MQSQLLISYKTHIMKKIFLLLLSLPVGVFAQNSSSPAPLKFYAPREGKVSPVQQSAPAPAAHNGGTHIRPGAAAYMPKGYIPAKMTAIGTTVYELQSNGALAKRLQIYGGGKMSYVWTRSDDINDKNFTNRYSGYNRFDGTNWLSTYGYSSTTDGFEGNRNGWPNIGEVTTGSSTYEILTSHYAQATGTIYAGGLFWNKNSAVGAADFTHIIDVSSNRDSTAGVLWPRMATSGNKVYLIGTYQDDRRISGVYNPIVYFCYNTSTKKFESKNITLPGYDSTRYGTGSADEYSIDARDSFVAIVTGGYETDLALWKSSDSGKTFTKTIINNFAAAPFNPKIGNTFDTAVADDGTAAVALDNKGVAHVTYSPVKVINTTQGDSGVSYFARIADSLVYWNDKDKQKINIGGCVDYDKNGNIQLGGNQTDQSYAGYGHDITTFSNIALDPSGNIYVVFSSPDEDDFDNNGNAYRHVYCSVFNAAQDTWLPQQDIVQVDQSGNLMQQMENIYATVARDANDSKIHLVFMQHDQFAGIYQPGLATSVNPVTTDTMIYEEVSTADLLSQKVGLVYLGVNQNMSNNLFSTGSIYPNPVADRLNVSLNLAHSATVTVKLFNMLGEQMQAQDYTMLPSGKNTLQFGVSNLPSGVYLCNVSAGGYTTTERVVVER